MCDDFYAVAKQTICYLNNIRLMRYGGISKKNQLDKVKKCRLFRLGRPAFLCSMIGSRMDYCFFLVTIRRPHAARAASAAPPATRESPVPAISGISACVSSASVVLSAAFVSACVTVASSVVSG